MIQFLTLVMSIIAFNDARKHREWEREKGD